jgi:hypothetical protein
VARRLELPVEEAETVASALRHVEFLDQEIAAVERQIARQALDSPELRRLMTGARCEGDLRGDVPARDRRHPPLSPIAAAGRLSRP